MNFDEAFERLRGHEGGYVFNKADPGGETKYGISKRQYPDLDIKNLTLDQAKAIYLRDYWVPCHADTVPDSIRFDLFDMAVNSGVTASIRIVQRAAGATMDGVFGPATLQACQSMDGSRLVARFNGARLAFMAELTDWPSFGRGWARRIAANLLA